MDSVPTPVQPQLQILDEIRFKITLAAWREEMEKLYYEAYMGLRTLL